MEETNQSYLATEKIGRLMGKYAVPCIISLLAGALYNIVDQIFIANANYLGSYRNAANTVVFPLTVIALAVAVMIGDGCCAFVSHSHGKKEPANAKRSVGNAVVLTIVASLLLTAVYLLFSSQIIARFGQAMNPVIRADGSPSFAMISTLAGAVINIILDPIFIFVFRRGMMGAAVATVLGQIATALLAVWYLCHTKGVTLSREDFKLKADIISLTLVLGICSFLSQIALVAAMAVVGIVMKFFQIVISIVVGMAAGCIPIAGYNMGAGLRDRVKNLFTRLLISESCVGALL